MRKYYLVFSEGSMVNQIICAVLINLPVFAYGASIGWMSPMSLLLQSEKSPRGVPLSDNEISWMAAAAYLTCIPSDFLMAFLGDKLGRKKTVIFISTFAVAAWIIKLSSVEPWAFILARSFIGITMAGSFVVCPVYTKEISQDTVRGFLGSFVIFFQTTGNLFAYVIGDLLNYRTVLWVCLSLPTLHLVLFMMMPESPSYLLKKGDYEEAARVLAWLRCRREDDLVVTQELDLLKKEQSNDEESSKYVLKALFEDKILFRAFRIAMVVALAREVCGSIPVLNFAGDIFDSASKGTSLVLTPNQQAMLLGVVQVAGSFLASGIVEKAGRKMLLFVTSLISGLSMCVLASWFLARSFRILAPSWIPVVTLCICIFCDASGLQPVSVLITGEIFSFKFRGTVMGIAMASASSTCFLQVLFFKPVASSIGVESAFYFFGAVCIAAAIYIIWVVPETRNRTLEEIYTDLKTTKEKAQEMIKGVDNFECADVSKSKTSLKEEAKGVDRI